MARFIAVGDNHVGKAIHLAASRLAEQEQAWRDVLEAARTENVDAILHAGDLFDARRPTPEVYLTAERPLVEHRDAGGPPVVMINGNHCLSGTSEHAAVDVLAEAGLIRLHREPEVVGCNGVGIVCLPWAPVSRLRAQLGADITVDELNVACAELLVRIAADLRGMVDGPAVLLAHWSVDNAVLPSGMSVADLREVVLPLADLEEIGFDAIVLGHIHVAQMLAAATPAFYVGSPMPLDFGEGDDAHGYWLIEDGQPNFVQLDSPRFVTLTVDDNDTGDTKGCYVRIRATADDEEIARSLEGDCRAEGAAYVRVEIEAKRSDRARVEALDETVSDEQAFAMWLEAQDGIDEATRAALVELDAEYREKVAP